MTRRSVSTPAARGSGSQHALRAANVRRIEQALRATGAMTQSALARTTGLSNATVSNLVRVMVDEQLVTTSATTSSGRRAVLVQLAGGSRRKVAVGIDIGRGHLRLVVVTPAREVLADVERTLEPGHRAQDTVAIAAAVLGDVLGDLGIDRADVLGCGVGIPAPIDRHTGRTSHGAVLPEWSGYPLREQLAAGLGVPVEVENDANLGALAELTWGGHGDVTDLVFVKVASGIGAGLIVGGRLHRGRDGKTGEIGHTTILEYGPVCRCGGRGCLEAIASGQAMLALWQASRPTRPATAESLVRHARAGDPTAVRIVEDAGLALGRVLGGVVNLLNPQLVVVSGPVTGAGELLVDSVAAGLSRFTSPVVAGPTRVTTSALKGSAEALGGCALVLRGAGDDAWASVG